LNQNKDAAKLNVGVAEFVVMGVWFVIKKEVVVICREKRRKKKK